ncbi:uncharacterized protein LOC123693409 isoform X2 [Colias croceus]|uniref:uncharacterized protein LOC123693409 isoform X2 n=1 Tax=Colias crocea TaxID=72248 RepID=UPI001E27CDFE|nr:uncharacterized protein LOC123693409 isoform X2 [Colias croceus]
MKRKLCATSFSCDDDMEELNAASLSHRKESAVPLTATGDPIFNHPFGYPLAVVLRLRVLQIVCGISKIIMGSVAFIEERQKLNMGLGIPAGSFSVLAAAVSIHTSRGWGMMSSGAMGVATAAVLWIVSICMLLALIVQCFRTILEVPQYNSDPEESLTSPRDLTIIAIVQIALASATLISALVCARIDLSA